MRKQSVKIVFLGDSITDAGKSLAGGSMVSIGQGYAMLIAARLGLKYPGQFEFVNAAVCGSRVTDLYARIKTDAWNQKPNIVSILIGVNDVWHDFDEIPAGVETSRFERIYRLLLEDTIERDPKVQFLLLEPFALRASATEAHWDEFHAEVLLRAEVVKRIAEDFHAYFVPLQKPLEEASKLQQENYWLADGVHPTPAGHQIIANAWLNAFEKI